MHLASLPIIPLPAYKCVEHFSHLPLTKELKSTKNHDNGLVTREFTDITMYLFTQKQLTWHNDEMA